MAVLNLPPFADEPTPRADARTDNVERRAVTFADADVAGRWIRAPGSLSELGAALRVAQDSSVDDVKSAPDVWAQARVFTDAIVREQHPLHPEATRQWRAMLALFALEKSYDAVYAISLKPVDLKNGPGASRFERVLTALPPHERLPQGDRPVADPNGAVTAEWNRPVLVRLRIAQGAIGGQVRYGDPIDIGIMNPACLLAPGRRTSRLQFPDIPWMKDGFRDPLELRGGEALPLVKLAILRRYVLTLRDGLDALSDSAGSDLLRGIRAALDRFAKDCERAGAAVAPIEVRVGPSATDTGLPPLYRLLRTTVNAVLPEDPASTSECIVRTRTDLKDSSPFAGVVLVDPAIAVTLGRHASNVIVWGVKSLGDLANPSELESVRSAAAKAGYFVATPDDLFTPVFLRLGNSALVSSHPEGLRDALLPFSPLSLLIAGPDALGAMVKVTGEPEIRQHVSLTLNLEPPRASNVAGGATSHAVQRTYAHEPQRGEGRLVANAAWDYGGVAIWPNFTHPDWKWHFARLASAKTNHDGIIGRYATSAAALATMLAPLETSERYRDFKTWCSSAPFSSEPLDALTPRLMSSPWLNRLRSLDTEGSSLEIEVSPHPFEAIVFTTTQERGLPHFPAGLALNSLRPAAAGAAGDTVALDFGTTNTVACFGDGAPVQFEDRVVFPIASSDSGSARRNMTALTWSFADFMPPAARQTPTPSVAVGRQVDDAATLTALAASDVMLFSSLIYFQPQTGSVADTVAYEKGQLDDVIARSRFNLKWSDDPLDTIAAQRYLRQFILMVAAEAIDNHRSLVDLKWRFSRPDSIEDHDRFENLIRKRLHEIIPQAPADALRPLCSEGLSTANFILSGGEGARSAGGVMFRPGLLNVILDIGGGTTDVAIWVDNRLTWSGSYKLAGGMFFTDHVVNNPELLRRFGLGNWADLLTDNDRNRRAVGELLFSHNTLTEALDKGWDEQSGAEDVKALVRTSFVFLGGMAWYLGLVVRGLIEKNVIQPAVLQNVAFALCGRGSGLFARLHGGRAEVETRVSRLLTLFSLAAGGEPARAPSVFVSSRPKLEVVGGMIVTPDRSAVPDLHKRLDRGHPFEPAGLDTPFGEVVLKAGESHHDAPAGAPGRSDLTGLRTFLDQLPEYGRFKLDIDHGGSQSAANGIQQDVLSTLQRAKDHVSEPPFVIALRSLVADMAATDRAKRLGFSDAPNSERR